MLGEWLEEQKEPVLGLDPSFEELIEKLAKGRPRPMRTLERVEEINLTMQQGASI